MPQEAPKPAPAAPVAPAVNEIPSEPLQSSEETANNIHQDQLPNEQFTFVNLQDIQNIPPPPASMGNTLSIDPRDLSLSSSTPMLQPALEVKPMKQEDDVGMMNAPPAPNHTPLSMPKTETQRVKAEQPPSFNQSPSITARSPSMSSITKKSPSVPPKPRPINTTPIMAAIAEECLQKARVAAHDVAMSSDESALTEYQGLITTSLSCFEAILRDRTLLPKQEALVRLRYASVLQEETENWMEAETALTKGVTLCDKHRLLDLKYCMQYAMLKVLFQRNHKAALKAADGHISDCEAYKHVHWYYAFRLLKAQFYLEMNSESESGHANDRGALDNLKAIQKIAEVRGDHSMTILASLLEGLIILKSETDEKQPEKIQSCLAQVAKFQFDGSVQIVQLQILFLVLDFASSLNVDTTEGAATKLRKLQKAIDECEDWGNVKSDFLVPVKKQASSSKTISADTAGIIVTGDEQNQNDFVIVSFMTKMELRALVFAFSGLAALHKPSQAAKTPEFFREGLKILETWDKTTLGIPYGPPVPLSVALHQRSWRIDTQAYLCCVLGLLAASHCHWKTTRMYIDKLQEIVSEETPTGIRLFMYYLTGSYFQGVGQLTDAMDIFKSSCYRLDSTNGPCFQAGYGELALLAGLNRLWLMQHESCRNDDETSELIEELQPFCNNHWNKDLRTAWHNVAAALVTEPPQQLNQQKTHIQTAMSGSRETSNVLGAAVTLCIMRSRFFENVMGDQALKSARAASKQAQRSGNMLWQSVADGMLAQSYDFQSQRDESQQEYQKATMEAKQAFSHDK